MNANKTLTGYFIRQFAMAASVYGQGSVTPSSGLYDEGSCATINASPASGWRFHHWAGDASGASASASVYMNAAKSVTAVFMKAYDLTTQVLQGEYYGDTGSSSCVGLGRASRFCSLAVLVRISFSVAKWTKVLLAMGGVSMRSIRIC